MSATTGCAPNEIAYGFRVNDSLAMLKNLPAENYNRLRQVKRKTAEETMAFANAMRKLRYNASHTDLQLTVGGYAYLCLYNGYIIPDLTNKKLNQQRVDPFKVLKKIDTLAYRLELPPIMTIHPIISIAQLKPAPPPNADPYRRPRPDAENPPSIQLKNDNEPENPAKFYEIERLLDRRITLTERVSYLIK